MGGVNARVDSIIREALVLTHSNARVDSIVRETLILPSVVAVNARIDSLIREALVLGSSNPVTRKAQPRITVRWKQPIYTTIIEGGLTLTTTLAAYIGNNLSCNPAYNQTNFPTPNFTGTTYISATPLVSTSCNPAIEDDSLNPITPAHVSPVSVKTMTPAYSGKRTILVVPYNYSGSGSGSGGHVNFGMNTDSTGWVSAACNSMQARGYDGLTSDWYGPGRYEDWVTLLLMAQCESMTGFTFAIMIDTSGGSYSTQAELESYLSYLQTTYFGSSAYRTWGGKCIVYMWGPTVLTDAEYAAAKASITTPMYWIGQGPGSLSMSSMDAAFDWVQPWSSGVSGTDPYNLAAKSSFIGSCHGSSKGSVLAISPGFNGTLTLTVSWSEGKYIPRNAGECWIQQSALVNSNISYIQAGGGTLVEIQDATWNDWAEGTQVEDPIDNSITVSASIAGSILSWSVSGGTGDETTLSDYVFLASPDGINVAVLGSQAPGGSHTFDLSTIGGWNGILYNIYVIAIGIPNVRTQYTVAGTYTQPH